MAPLVDVGVVGIAELLLRLIDELARIHGIEYLLLVQWNTSNVDGLKPFLDFLFRAVADIDEQPVGVIFSCSSLVSPVKYCSIPNLSLMANFPVTKRPILVIRCCPSSISFPFLELCSSHCG